MVPVFPLNTVLFPGTSVPLHVFEDRYRALVARLLEVEDPADRLFASVAIREGYEVGDHGAQSLHRVGVLLQLTEVTSHEDGTYDVVAVARERVRLERMDTSGPCPMGEVSSLPDALEPVPDELVTRVSSLFTGYAATVAQLHDEDPHPGSLPRDPEYLGWTLAAVAPLPMPDQQEVLEARDSASRLVMLAEKFREELSAMNVIPSLPATQVARTGWSPN